MRVKGEYLMIGSISFEPWGLKGIMVDVDEVSQILLNRFNANVSW